MPTRRATAIAVVALLASAETARAQATSEQAREETPSADTVAEETPAPRSRWEPHWKPQWPRFHPLEGVLMFAAESAAIAIYFVEPNRSPYWRDPAPLDAELRDALRIESQEDRHATIVASDLMLYTILPWPIAIDAVLLAGLVHGDTDTMVQMILIDLETLAVAHLFTWATTRLVGRVRPVALECTVDDSCADRGVGPVASFVSGHASMSYAAAGLICSHHISHPWLTGSREGAAIACASGLAVATTIGLLRINADQHWASDVALGAAVGSAIGFGIPFGLHYARERLGGALRSSAPAIALAPPSAGDAGLAITGVF